VQKTTCNFTGVQWGLVGIVDHSFSGWQANIWSATGGAFTGLQMGALYSYARSVNGVQISFFNNAGSMKGIQIGIVNLIQSGGFMPVFPFVNWGSL